MDFLIDRIRSKYPLTPSPLQVPCFCHSCASSEGSGMMSASAFKFAGPGSLEQLEGHEPFLNSGQRP